MSEKCRNNKHNNNLPSPFTSRPSDGGKNPLEEKLEGLYCDVYTTSTQKTLCSILIFFHPEQKTQHFTLSEPQMDIATINSFAP